MLVHIDKGEKVKIKNITFEGNEAFSDKKLRKAMKNTKKKMPVRIFKGSKYIEADFKEDLENIVTTYSEKGHRDARVIDHSLTWNEKNKLNINVKLKKEKNIFLEILNLLGNSKYTDRPFTRILRIEKGDTYNGKVLLKKNW